MIAKVAERSANAPIFFLPAMPVINVKVLPWLRGPTANPALIVL